MEKTEFKLAILKGLADEFSGMPVHFRVEPYQSFSDINEFEWDAILVMVPVYADDIPAPSRDFLESLSSSRNAILFATSGNADVPVQVDGVDAVSSSSLRLERVDSLTRELISLLRKRL